MATKHKRKNTVLLIILFLFVILFGLVVIIYPLFASWYAEQTRSLVQSEYQEQIQQIDTSALREAKEKAQDYNKRLYEGTVDVLDPQAAGYYEQLNLTGKEIMGYLEIPRLGLYLPIYHGIGAGAMSNGCGHMPQSSLPVGGPNTHAVLSSHSGMAAPLFSDLDKMQPGDLFFLYILDETLTYEVESQLVVWPQDISYVKIETGKDLCTLITCYPYGVNTQRLLVRANRVETPEKVPEETSSTDEEQENEVNAQALWLKRYSTGILYGLIGGSILLVITIVVILIVGRYKKRKKQSSGTSVAEDSAHVS